jgi:hypothetical protein
MPTISALTPLRRSVVVVFAHLTAWAVYAIGLVAPLTPSEGSPSSGELLFFVGIPVAIHFWCTQVVVSRLAAVFAGLQLVAVLGFTAWLLLPYWGASLG